MNAVERVIFDVLARRGSVAMPGVGSLEVKRRKAHRVSETRVIPPQNVVVFSHDEPRDVPSVVDLMNRNAAMSMDDALATYNEWLAEARQDGALIVEGVGTVRDERFEPTDALHEILNPTGLEVGAPASAAGSAAEIGAAAAGAAGSAAGIGAAAAGAGDGYDERGGRYGFGEGDGRGAGGAGFGDGSGRKPRAGSGDGYRYGRVRRRGGAGVSRGGARWPWWAWVLCGVGVLMLIFGLKLASNADFRRDFLDGLMGRPEVGEVVPTVAPTADTVRMTEPVAVPVGPRFHVIAGAFLEPGNADRRIEELRRDYPGLTLAKVKNPNGYEMVSIFSSPVEADAYRELNRSLHIDDWMWVYNEQ